MHAARHSGESGPRRRGRCGGGGGGGGKSESRLQHINMKVFTFLLLTCAGFSNAYIYPTYTTSKGSYLRSATIATAKSSAWRFGSSNRPKMAQRVKMQDTGTGVANSDKPDQKKSNYFGCDPNATPPPRSFQMCVEQAFLSSKSALEKGYRLLEVEFPPLPSKALENEALGADVVLSAQIDHAKEFARLFEGKKVAIVFPDMVERNRFIQDTSFSKTSQAGNFRFSALGGGFKGSWIERLWVQQEYVADVTPEDDLFIIIGASAQELPDVQRLCDAAGDRPVILFNLKLQTLRGDLGLPAFPSKDLHYSWLSKALPVYHVLPRSYTRTLSRPPFLINYSGCLFRTFPGKWQVVLLPFPHYISVFNPSHSSSKPRRRLNDRHSYASLVFRVT